MIRIVYPLLASLDEYLLLATSFVLPIICGVPLASSEVGMDHVSVKKNENPSVLPWFWLPAFLCTRIYIYIYPWSCTLVLVGLPYYRRNDSHQETLPVAGQSHRGWGLSHKASSKAQAVQRSRDNPAHKRRVQDASRKGIRGMPLPSGRHRNICAKYGLEEQPDVVVVDKQRQTAISDADIPSDTKISKKNQEKAGKIPRAERGTWGWMDIVW